MGCTIPVVPETHQEVGTHPHQLPEHVDLEEIRADDQPQHRAAEQRQVSEKADVALVVGHVAVGVHHHQQSDGGHQGEHHGGQGIHHETHRQHEAAGAGPDEQAFHRRSAGQLSGKDGVAQHRGCTHAADQQQRHRLAQPVDGAVETDQAKASDHGSRKGKHRDQPGKFRGRRHPLSTGCSECRQLSSAGSPVLSCAPLPLRS